MWDRSQLLRSQFPHACGGMLPVKQCNVVVVGDTHAFESLAAIHQARECNVGSASIQQIQCISSSKREDVQGDAFRLLGNHARQGRHDGPGRVVVHQQGKFADRVCRIKMFGLERRAQYL